MRGVTRDAIDFVTVGIVDYGTNTVAVFEAFGVKFCLMLSYIGVFACAFRFNYCERVTGRTEQHIVGIAFTSVVGHTCNFDFNASFTRLDVTFILENVPAGLTEHEVDIAAACFCF